ncbi:transcription termination factor Rho [Solimonas aquatica]|uniref:Transcription termination factor Rho n=2 Tax=Solimonas aquatica TaxID=489703 RepID=A0A1H9GMG2_9GAMM|nr:transcription termination factor Rho [Solimonas aquatica]
MKHRRRFSRGGQNNRQQGNQNQNHPFNGNGFPEDIQPEDVEGGDEASALSLSAEAHAGQPAMPAPQMSDDGSEEGVTVQVMPATPPEPPKIVRVPDLKRMTASELLELAEAQGLENIARIKKQDLIFQILRAAAKRGEHIYTEGVLEIMQDGYGFLRGPDSSYLAGPDDVYISPSQIRRFALRTGDSIAGRVRSPKDNERYFALLKVDTINFEPPEVSKRKVSFENLTPLFADKQYKMERGNGSTEDITARIIDLVAPFGKGQRGLIVSPPKAGKTIMLQNIAQSIAGNYPDAYLIVLLIDERPEEVTDMQRTVRGEVVASTFDEPASRHVQVAEMVIEKAKRLVEHKRDVVILLDSITRLARAYNTVAPSSGKVLTGGVDANALQKPKRFFGAARNIEEGGSLTIIATALVETGSKMDEVIYEEFKGTGNMELHLERRIAEKRVFPAININRSGTRKEELMMDPADLNKVWILRKLLHDMDEIAAMELLMDRMKQTKTNAAFFDSMKRN